MGQPGGAGRRRREAAQAPEGPQPPKISSRRRRNLLRTLAIVLVLVAVTAGAGAVSAYRYADRLVGKGQRPVAGLTPVAGGPMNILLVGSDSRAGLSRRQLGRIQTVEVAGRRTDTIIVLHVSPDRGRR